MKIGDKEFEPGAKPAGRGRPMRRIQAILLLTFITCAPAAVAEAPTNSASLACTPAKGRVFGLGLSSYTFSTTQLIDPNTGSPTGKISSSLKFETPFGSIYKTLQTAAAGNEVIPSCTLTVRAPSTVDGIPHWVISNAVFTNLDVEGEEGSGDLTNIVGTLTFTSVEFAWP